MRRMRSLENIVYMHSILMSTELHQSRPFSCHFVLYVIPFRCYRSNNQRVNWFTCVQYKICVLTKKLHDTESLDKMLNDYHPRVYAVIDWQQIALGRDIGHGVERFRNITWWLEIKVYGYDNVCKAHRAKKQNGIYKRPLRAILVTSICVRSTFFEQVWFRFVEILID